MSRIARQECQHKRRVLFARDPRCHWCAAATKDPRTCNQQDPLMATLDHIKSRLQCEDAAEYRSGNNHVIACLKCNAERDRVFHLTEQPWIDAPYKHRHSKKVWVDTVKADIFAAPSWEAWA